MQPKVSRYLVVSEHAYEIGGADRVRLVLSGRTGALVAVPPELADALLRGQAPPPDDPRAGALRDAEVLVPADEDELAALVRRNLRAAEDTSRVSFTILPSSHCNMGCDYCGQQHSKGGMDGEAERAAVARVSAAMARPTTRSVHVTWFGGEPMAGYPSLLRMSDAMVRAAEERGVRYDASIVTNGSLLTLERIEALHQRAKVTSLDVTLDGPPEVHDRRRLIRGRQSFHHITETLLAALASPALAGLRVRIRTNIDVRNAEAVPAYLEEMKRLGFDRPRVHFDLHEIYSWSNDVSAIEVEKENFAAWKVAWLLQMVRLGLRFTALPVAKREVVCVAVQDSNEVISATGSIFSCTEHPLVPEHEQRDALGSLADPPDRPRRRGSLPLFTERVARGEFPCHSCHIFGICGGACPKHWIDGHPPCPDHKYNMQARLDIAAHQRGWSIV